MNMAKPSEVIQRETESPFEFYERLCEAYRLYMPIGPEAAGCQMVINAGFVSQAYPNIRHKLQNMDRVLAMTNSQMIEIAVKVFRNRGTEIQWETEKKRREDSKTADQQIPFLAAALGRPFPGSSPKFPLSWSLSLGKPPTRRPRATLQPNQCA